MIGKFKKYLNNERGSFIETPLGMVITALVVIAVVGIAVRILTWTSDKADTSTEYVDKQFEQWLGE